MRLTYKDKAVHAKNEKKIIETSNFNLCHKRIDVIDIGLSEVF